MIVTITLNPAVDINYRLDSFVLDDVNRVSDVLKTAGGKGLNVAKVINQLEETVGASGFLGGSLGEFIRKEIKRQNIHDRFVEISGETRNCIAILHDGKQTEILEQGPTISKAEQEKFLTNYQSLLKEVDIITLSGSLPAGLTSEFYERLIAHGTEAGKKVFLDTGGDLLQEILKNEKPFLIKPNESEFAQLIGQGEVTKEDVIEALKDPLFHGIEWVVVTFGKDGAIVKHQDEVYDVNIPTVEAINPVGSGDSVIAGFSVAVHRGYDVEQTIRFGLTMGILNAMEEETGSINPKNIHYIEKKIHVKNVCM